MSETVNGITGQYDRKFYDLTHVFKSRSESSFFDSSVDTFSSNFNHQIEPENVEHDDGRSQLMTYVENNIIGRDLEFSGPFGKRKITYCDYTASGKALSFIEAFLATQVLPFYGNTHTTTTVTSLQTTLYRHEAREIIRNAVGASEDDAVVFVGSGCTGAVHKLINGLCFTNPPIVFVGATEHHSNLLPWREIAAEVVRIQEGDDGLLDLSQLEAALQAASEKKVQMIGCFSAASNITGTLMQDLEITHLLHTYGAFSFWDYAAAAPYVKLSMNPSTPKYPSGTAHKDAVYFSMHKFIGGIQTPGILIVKKALLRNQVPNGAGGGTVFFVGREMHKYLKDPEMREEGGTPAIVESIRAGLIMNLKENMGVEAIMKREAALIARAYETWNLTSELIILGSHQSPRLAIFSFIIRHPSTGLYLHHNFVSALLNDLYGIQSRGGCACAGPYAQDLLGIDDQLAVRYESILMEDRRLDRTHLRRKEEHSSYEILRPGFTRLNLAYFASDAEIDFILQAVIAVAQRGWTMLPYYQMNAETGEWHHHNQLSFKDRKWLGNVDYSLGYMRVRQPNKSSAIPAPSSYQECLDEAQLLFDKALRERGWTSLPDQLESFNEEAAKLRWFLLPSEAQELLRGNTPQQFNVPFTPRKYTRLDKSSAAVRYDANRYSTIPTGADLIVPDPQSTPHTFIVTQERSDRCTLVNEFENDDVEEDEKPLSLASFDLHSQDEDQDDEASGLNMELKSSTGPSLWKSPVRTILKPTLEAILQFNMISNGDRVLVCVSGGKDSLTLLHTLRQYQHQAYRHGVEFQLGAITVDPGSSAYDPSPLIPYMESLGIPYFYEKQCIINQALDKPDLDSICSFCSRLKRGRIYATARTQGYNVIALGQHLDDLAESFLMSTFHNGRLRTMKAAYVNRQRDLKIIRPFVYVREKELRQFAQDVSLPVIPENCPACFEAPKERHRIKQLLAQQELLYPRVFLNLKTSLLPLMSVSEPGVEKQLYGKYSYVNKPKRDQRV